MARSAPANGGSANSAGARAGRAAARLFRASQSHAASGGGADVRRAVARGGRTLLTRWGGAARRLGLQVAGVLYLVFALAFGSGGYQSWARGHRGLGPHPSSLTQMSATTAVELGLALLFAYFGLSSFVRAGRRP